MAYWIYDMEIGPVLIEEQEGAITRISTDCRSTGVKQETEVIQQAHVELEEYLEGKRNHFAVKVTPEGTAFQKTVWKALQTIPCGETRTYGQIAAQIGKPGAARAVGGACNKNPILMMIPCHRVVGAGGALVGFGAGLPLKEKLLNLEKLHLDAVEKQCYNK